MAALRDGRIDYSTFSNPDIGRLVAGDKRLVVDTQATSNYYRLDINALSDKSAFKDKRVRQAMNLAIDRDAIANIVFAGASKPDYPVPSAFGKNACRDVDTYRLPRAERDEAHEGVRKAAGAGASLLGALAPELAAVLAAPRLADEDRQDQFVVSVAGFLDYFVGLDLTRVIHLIALVLMSLMAWRGAR